MKKLDLTHDALKFVETLQAKQFRQVVQKVFALLSDQQPSDARQLRGYLFWRADIGEFRIVYRFDESTVFIEAIGKRNDDEVYRKLNRS